MNEIVKIERMSYGADAIGHLSSGKAVFVSGGVPGDTVDVEITEEKPTFARGRVFSVVEPSSDRVAPDIALPSSIAPWGGMSYGLQLRSKEDNVRSALVRGAHMPADDVGRVLRPVVASPHPLRYRNKLEMAAFRDARGQLQLGFHDDSDSVTAFAGKKLAMAVKPLETAPKSVTGALRYIMGNEDLGLYRVGVRGSEATGSIEVALWTPPSGFPRAFSAKVLNDAVGATSVVRVIADEGKARRVKRVEVLYGDGLWHEEMATGPDGRRGASPLSFSVQAPSFFQVNTEQASSMVRFVMEELGNVEGMAIADLYSGAGTFSIPLALAGADVSAIELAGSAARDLERNCAENDAFVDVICDDTSRALPMLDELDAIVVDPPKFGLDSAVVDQIADAAPERLVYVSCDPQTLARDISRLSEKGFALQVVQPFDMFPQTWHVENVAVLMR